MQATHRKARHLPSCDRETVGKDVLDRFESNIHYARPIILSRMLIELGKYRRPRSSAKSGLNQSQRRFGFHARQRS
jgi:hypothetical protein